VKSLSFRCFDRPALDHAAAVHYTSEDERGEASRLNLKSRAVVIPLGIDLEPFRSLHSPELFFSQFPPARGRDIVLFLSRVNPKKGLDEFLPAFADAKALHPNALLVIAGEGEKAYLDSLKLACQKLNLLEDVVWTGMIGGELKLAAFAAAKAFVLPSYSENFGIALLEAMAAGLPCLSTAGVALAREAEGAVLLSKTDRTSIAGSLNRLLADEAMRRDLATRGAALARERYSLQAMGTSLVRLYSELAT
jgi:glycosyltransferase involved in cell wall biosynthesis